MPVRAWYMPQTVPSSPTKGAVEPTVASRTWPNCSLSSTPCNASRSNRVRCCERSAAGGRERARRFELGGGDQRQHQRLPVQGTNALLTLGDGGRLPEDRGAAA